MLILGCLICFITPIVAFECYRHIQEYKWRKYVRENIAIKETITVTINGKDYEYNPNENFEKFFKNHLTNE